MEAVMFAEVFVGEMLQEAAEIERVRNARALTEQEVRVLKLAHFLRQIAPEFVPIEDQYVGRDDETLGVVRQGKPACVGKVVA